MVNGQKSISCKKKYEDLFGKLSAGIIINFPIPHNSHVNHGKKSTTLRSKHIILRIKHVSLISPVNIHLFYKIRKRKLENIPTLFCIKYNIFG